MTTYLTGTTDNNTFDVKQPDDTVITATTADIITLKNVTLSSVHEDDFSFAMAS